MAQLFRDTDKILVLIISFCSLYKTTNSEVVRLSKLGTDAPIETFDFNCHEEYTLKMLSFIWLIWYTLRPTDGVTKIGYRSLWRVKQSRRKTKWRGPRVLTWLEIFDGTQKAGLFYLILLLLVAGNINPNPGPIKYPCGTCGKPCRSNQRSVLCDGCQEWSHWKGSTSNRNGPEWAEMDRNGPEWTEMGRNVPKWEISFFIFPSCFLHLIIVYLNFGFSFVEMKDFICVSTEIT